MCKLSFPVFKEPNKFGLQVWGALPKTLPTESVMTEAHSTLFLSPILCFVLSVQHLVYTNTRCSTMPQWSILSPKTLPFPNIFILENLVQVLRYAIRLAMLPDPWLTFTFFFPQDSIRVPLPLVEWAHLKAMAGPLFFRAACGTWPCARLEGLFHLWESP